MITYGAMTPDIENRTDIKYFIDRTKQISGHLLKYESACWSQCNENIGNECLTTVKCQKSWKEKKVVTGLPWRMSVEGNWPRLPAAETGGSHRQNTWKTLMAVHCPDQLHSWT